jgi:hypothetical protein
MTRRSPTHHATHTRHTLSTHTAPSRWRGGRLHIRRMPHMYLYMQVRMYLYVRTYTCRCVCTFMYVPIHIGTHVPICMYLYTEVHIYLYVRTYKYRYAYTSGEPTYQADATWLPSPHAVRAESLSRCTIACKPDRLHTPHSALPAHATGYFCLHTPHTLTACTRRTTTPIMLPAQRASRYPCTTLTPASQSRVWVHSCRV